MLCERRAEGKVQVLPQEEAASKHPAQIGNVALALSVYVCVYMQVCVCVCVYDLCILKIILHDSVRSLYAPCVRVCALPNIQQRLGMSHLHCVCVCVCVFSKNVFLFLLPVLHVILALIRVTYQFANNVKIKKMIKPHKTWSLFCFLE
jgi:hypothetical protein